ncbi:MAG: peptidylprolyl isomerase [Nitrospiraceae bacterium]
MNRALSGNSTKAATAVWCVASVTRWSLRGRPLIFACLLGLIGFGVTGCQPASSDPPVVAIVNGRMITQEEFDYRWQELAQATRARYERAGGKRQFLEELITHELFMQEAKKLGLDQSQSIRDRTHQYREKLILDELVRQRVKTSVEVSKSEVDAYLASHAHELLLPAKVRAGVIVSANIFASKDIRRMLAEGADFGKLAVRFSVDQATRTKGGDLGPLRKGTARPELESLILSLRPGMISDPVKIDDLYYVVKVETLDQETIQADLAIRERLRQELLNEKRRQRLDDLVAELKKTATIRYSTAAHHLTEPPRESTAAVRR